MTGPGADSGDDRIGEVLRAGLEWVALRAIGDADLAREALQETLARTLAALDADRIPATVRLPAYAHGILRHVIADLRSEHHHWDSRSPDPEWADPTEASPLERLITEEEEARVRRAVMTMPPEERELLVRCFVHGERVAELARSLGVPAARVRKRKSRAIAKLRAVLAPEPARHVPLPTPTYRV
jgi:RNA polymerase sigma-70 factor (ECF subfamily)